MKRFATIDVGSNSVLLHVADRADDGRFHRVADETEVTRLSEGLRRTGRIAPAAADRTAAAIGRYVARARALGVDAIAAVGTMCMRSAANAAELVARVEREHGVRIEIVAGEEEAYLSFLSVADVLPVGGRVGIVDIGGGSTELLCAVDGRVESRGSVDVGVVRFHEEVLVSDPVTADEVARARRELAEGLAALPLPGPVTTLVGVGGTFTTIVAVARGMAVYDPAVVEGARLTVAEVERQVALYQALPVAARRALPGMVPGRADVILAGALIAATMAGRLGVEELTVSDRGVRHGLLRARFGG